MLASVVLFPEFREFLNMNRGSISVILTSVLVFLYFVQYQTQRNQHKLMKANNDPNLVIEGYRGGREDISQGNLEISVSNIGNGVANNIVLVTNIQVDHSHIIEHIVETELTKSNSKQKNWFQGSEVYINPDDFSESYNASVGLKWKNIPENTVITGSITSFIESLEELGVKTFRIQLSLKYHTPDGRPETKNIADLMVPVEENIKNVNDVLHHGLEYDLYRDEIQHPGNPFERFSYAESPLGLTRFETEPGPPDEIEILTSEELIEIFDDLSEGEHIHVRRENNTVTPIIVMKVEEGKNGEVTVSGRKEIGEKNPVLIKSEDGDYFLFEDLPYLEGYEKKQKVINIDRKHDR
ncbi:hypothetical protein [Halorubrum sp. F4]|uniref:hypothetical protein n=1 Tax=Halorubrum sp. F4 TaxID=2989715 RepID=UPI0024816EBA|nr:hypothetical protein [Halorubrum sp. F4]